MNRRIVERVCAINCPQHVSKQILSFHGRLECLPILVLEGPIVRTVDDFTHPPLDRLWRMDSGRETDVWKASSANQPSRPRPPHVTHLQLSRDSASPADQSELTIVIAGGMEAGACCTIPINRTLINKSKTNKKTHFLSGDNSDMVGEWRNWLLLVVLLTAWIDCRDWRQVRSADLPFTKS